MRLYTTTIPEATPIKVVSASAHYGIGFLTSFVEMFASIFGFRNALFSLKIEKAETYALDEIYDKAMSLRADGVMDIHFQVQGLTVFVSGTAYKLNKPTNSNSEIKEQTWLNKPTNSNSEIKEHKWRCANCGMMRSQDPCEFCGGGRKTDAPYY